jgi:hypothetical protein
MPAAIIEAILADTEGLLSGRVEPSHLVNGLQDHSLIVSRAPASIRKTS